MGSSLVLPEPFQLFDYMEFGSFVKVNASDAQTKKSLPFRFVMLRIFSFFFVFLSFPFKAL